MKDYNYKFNKDGKLKVKINLVDKNKGIVFIENLLIFLTVLSVFAGVLFFLMRGLIWVLRQEGKQDLPLIYLMV